MIGGQFIYAWLTEDAEVSAVVGTRVYPVLAPQDAAFPHINYQETGRTYKPAVKQPQILRSIQMDLRLWDRGYDSYKDLHDLANKIIGDRTTPNLDGFKGEKGGQTMSYVRVDSVRDEAIFANDGSEDYFRAVTITLTMFPEC